MPSTTHQALVEIFRSQPALAPALLEQVAHATLPEYSTAAATEAALDQLVPTEFRADLVVELRDVRGQLRGNVVVEVQLAPDSDKGFSWPVYVAALRARARNPVWLLVVAPDIHTAAWARTPIEIAAGNPHDLAIVLGPEQTPPITDPDVAAQHPELTLLAAVAHGHDPAVEPLIPVLPAVLHALDAERRVGYLSMLLEALAPAFRKRLEVLLLHPDFAAIKLPSPWQEMLDASQARGEARGEAHGKAHGKAEAILAVLAARKIAVADDIRDRILTCDDLPTLDRWLRRAATLKTAAAVVRNTRSG